jgi:positive regulator of sigma E activity
LFGDISGLWSQLRAQKIMDPILIEKSRIRSAVLVSIAVLLFIISALAVIVFDSSKLGLVIFFFAIALGVSLLIFNSMTKLRYKFVAKTHRLAYGMKATFLWVDFNIEQIYYIRIKR